MGHDRIITIKDSAGSNYSVDKWESTSRSPASSEWKYPARIKNLEGGRRLDRWETADRPNRAMSDIEDPLEVAIEGIERLLIDHHVNPEVITVTRNAPFSSTELASEIDVDAEIVSSTDRSIRS